MASSVLSEVLGIEVERSDGLPEFICLHCLKELLRAYTFRQKCLKGYESFGVNPFNVKYQEEDVEYESTIHEVQEIQPEEKFNTVCQDESEQVATIEVGQADEAIVQEIYLIKAAEGGGYKCEICGKILRKMNSYKYHKQLHSEETKFHCNICGQQFKTKNTYEGHKMLHEQRHKCKICDKVYRQASSLRSHQLNHSGEKPFK